MRFETLRKRTESNVYWIFYEHTIETCGTGVEAAGEGNGVWIRIKGNMLWNERFFCWQSI